MQISVVERVTVTHLCHNSSKPLKIIHTGTNVTGNTNTNVTGNTGTKVAGNTGTKVAGERYSTANLQRTQRDQNNLYLE